MRSLVASSLSFASLMSLIACGVALDDPSSGVKPDGDPAAAGDGGGVLSPSNGNEGGDGGGTPFEEGPERAVEISAGGGLSCARTNKGRVFCWGANGRNVIGPTDKEMPCRVPQELAATTPVNQCIALPFSMGGGLDKIVKVAVGRFHACAVRADGTAACFGSNDSGGIGMGNVDNGPHGATDLPNVQKAIDVSLGFHGSCLLRGPTAAAGPNEVWCWGPRDLGLTGAPPVEQQGGGPMIVRPQRHPKLDGAKMVRVSRDYPNACAIDQNDDVVCWGVNHRGILGHGEGQSGDKNCFLGFGGGGQPCTPDPQLIGVKATDLAVGSGFACAIAKDDERIVCWGRNSLATLGLGSADEAQHTTINNVQMMGVGVLHATSISSTWNHVCAMTKEKGPVCWGANNNRQTGAASGASVCGGGDCTGPRQIPTADALDAITAGWETTYFRTKASGAFTAMGNNDFAQLGHAPNTLGDKKCAGEVACADTPLPLTFTF